MNVELSGIVYSVGEARQVTEKMTVREFVLQVEEVDGEYERTQYYPMQLTGKNIDKLTPADSGKQVTVKGNLDGRKFNRKTGEEGFMLSMTMWYVRVEGEGTTTTDVEQEEENSDLPF